MSRPHIINALDIGTNSVKLLSVAKKQNEDGFEVIGQEQELSAGVRRGVVIDPIRASEIVGTLIERMENSTGNKIDGVYAGVGGGHICSISSRGLVSVSRADQKISGEDIDRVIHAAKTFPIPPNKEVIGIFPREFIVDGVSGIKEAIGMQGVRLEADVLVLCGFSPYLKNSNKTVLNSGVQINNLIPDILASSKAILTPREKELGVCVLDIGAGTTGMSVFEEGALIHAAVFPVGSAHITNDVAVCLKTDIDTAERIKVEFGSCRSGLSEEKKADRNEKKIRIEGDDPLVFAPKMLSDIIGARVSEIFDLTNKELKKISRVARLPAGVVLTGGGSKISGIKELAKRELKLPVRIGAPNISMAVDDPSLSAVCGLALEGFHLEAEEGTKRKRRGGFGNSVKNIFKIFIP